jgi:hypothetical protein
MDMVAEETDRAHVVISALANLTECIAPQLAGVERLFHEELSQRSVRASTRW